MDEEVTVAELVARAGGTWPRTEQAPRHLLDETAEPERGADVVEPRQGGLLDWYAGAVPPASSALAAPKPQRPTVDYLEGEAPALVRRYVRPQ